MDNNPLKPDMTKEEQVGIIQSLLNIFRHGRYSKARAQRQAARHYSRSAKALKRSRFLTARKSRQYNFRRAKGK